MCQCTIRSLKFSAAISLQRTGSIRVQNKQGPLLISWRDFSASNKWSAVQSHQATRQGVYDVVSSVQSCNTSGRAAIMASFSRLVLSKSLQGIILAVEVALSLSGCQTRLIVLCHYPLDPARAIKKPTHKCCNWIGSMQRCRSETCLWGLRPDYIVRAMPIYIP